MLRQILKAITPSAALSSRKFAQSPQFSRQPYAQALSRTLLLILGLCLLQTNLPGNSLAATDSVNPHHFAGVWSNKKNEFKTLTFSLRKDGHGTFNTAVLSGLARWERTASGIRLKYLLPAESSMGRPSEMQLDYDAAQNILFLKSKNGKELLYKVSAEEPEDLESRFEKSVIAKQPQDQKQTFTLTGRDAVLAELPVLLPSEGRNATFVQIAPSGHNWEINIIHHGEHQWELSALTDKRSVDQPAKAVTTRRYLEQTAPALPIKYRMDEAALARLKQRLDASGVGYDTRKFVTNSLWQPEIYYERLSTKMIGDHKTLMVLTRFLLTDIYVIHNTPLEVVVRDQVVQ